MNTAKYAALFLTESRDNIAAVNEALLELERNPTAATPLDSLFRAVHTVKGMAGVMSYDAVVELAHAMESLLARVRDGTRPLTPDDTALLFDAADALERTIERAVAGERAGDFQPILERLRSITGAPSDGAWSAGADFRVQLPAGAGLAVHVRLAGDAPLKGARAYLILQRARSLGEVTAIVPNETALREERFGVEFAIRLRTDESEDRVAEVLREAGYVEQLGVRRDAAGPAGPPRAPNEAERADAAWATGTLKAPLQRYVRIDLHRLDALMNLIGELVIARGRLAQIVARYADPELDDGAAAVSRLVADLQEAILSSRMVPVWQVFDRFPRVVRDAARSLGKEIDFVLDGREIELDRALLEQMGDPLIHLLRNAVDHGIESPEAREAAGKPRAGRLVLSAARDRSTVVIRVTDDGRGIDRRALLRRAQEDGVVDAEKTDLSDDEVLRLIARPGFSTAEQVTDLSGRGVGVDAVVSRVRALGGSVELRSERGSGTSLSLRLPITLAIMPALLARVESETYALPLTHIRETLQLSPDVVRQVRGRDVLVLRDEVLPLLSLRRVVELPARDAEGSQVVVLEVADRRAGLVVDQLMGQQEVVVKPFDAVRGAAACFSGATILSDGAPALILEATSLL
jgi:two-component system chemotaxis sensor kinase CheA